MSNPPGKRTTRDFLPSSTGSHQSTLSSTSSSSSSSSSLDSFQTFSLSSPFPSNTSLSKIRFLECLRLDDLRPMLRSRGLPRTGLKEDVVGRVARHLSDSEILRAAPPESLLLFAEQLELVSANTSTHSVVGRRTTPHQDFDKIENCRKRIEEFWKKGIKKTFQPENQLKQNAPPEEEKEKEEERAGGLDPTTFSPNLDMFKARPTQTITATTRSTSTVTKHTITTSYQEKHSSYEYHQMEEERDGSKSTESGGNHPQDHAAADQLSRQEVLLNRMAAEVPEAFFARLRDCRQISINTTPNTIQNTTPERKEGGGPNDIMATPHEHISAIILPPLPPTTESTAIMQGWDNSSLPIITNTSGHTNITSSPSSAFSTDLSPSSSSISSSLFSSPLFPLFWKNVEVKIRLSLEQTLEASGITNSLRLLHDLSREAQFLPAPHPEPPARLLPSGIAEVTTRGMYYVHDTPRGEFAVLFYLLREIKDKHTVIEDDTAYRSNLPERRKETIPGVGESQQGIMQRKHEETEETDVWKIRGVFIECR